MNERQITMQAIRYLAQVSEALSSTIVHGGAGADHAALEAGLKCADHIEHIAQYDVEELDVRARLRGVEESMRWLHVTRERYDALLSNSRQHVPFASDLQTLASIAYRLQQETSGQGEMTEQEAPVLSPVRAGKGDSLAIPGLVEYKPQG